MSSAIRATDRRAPAGGWRQATVREITHPTPRGVMLRLEVDDRVEHMAGQHYVVRLSAPDGYIAQRSYSVASPPSDPQCEFFVEHLDNGEVSTYLAEGLMAAGAFIALTRETSASGRPAGRLSPAEITSHLVPQSTYYVCGSAGFAEATSSQLVEAGVDGGLIRVERFGPSG